MKKLLALLVLFLLVATPFVISKPMREWTEEYYDLDCDGTDDLVYVYTSEKTTKKSTTKTKEYYDENWNYLGEEEWVNGELIMDTFEANDPDYCPDECQTDEDCPDGEWKCELEPPYYYEKTVSCVDGQCVYADWTWGGCIKAVQLCDNHCDGALCGPKEGPCDTSDDCESHHCEPPCTCGVE